MDSLHEGNKSVGGSAHLLVQDTFKDDKSLLQKSGSIVESNDAQRLLKAGYVLAATNPPLKGGIGGMSLDLP